MPIAVIVGIGSRRGMALARYLSTELQYDLHAFLRWQDIEATRQRIVEFGSFNISLHTPKMNDAIELFHLLRDIRPQEIYSLHWSQQQHFLESPIASSPSSSHHPEAVASSFFRHGSSSGHHRVEDSMLVEGMLTLRLLEAMRMSGLASTRFFQEQRVLNVDSFAAPCRFETPNSCSKLFSHWTVRHYREVHGSYAVNGVFFEKVLSFDDDVGTFADDICRRLAVQFMELHLKNRNCIRIELHDNETVGSGGNINYILDKRWEWSHADDFAEGIWMSINSDQEQARDYVFATRQFYSLRDFCDEAYVQITGGGGTSNNTENKLKWRNIENRHALASIGESTAAVIHIKFACDDDWSYESGAKTSFVVLPDETLQMTSGSNSENVDDNTTNTGSSTNDAAKVEEFVAKTQHLLKWSAKRSFGDIVAEYLKIAKGSLGGTGGDNNDQENSDVLLTTGANLLLLEE